MTKKQIYTYYTIGLIILSITLLGKFTAYTLAETLPIKDVIRCELISVRSDSIVIETTVPIQNMNMIPVKLRTFELLAYKIQQPIGTITLDRSLTIPAYTEKAIKLTARLNFNETIAALADQEDTLIVWGEGQLKTSFLHTYRNFRVQTPIHIPIRQTLQNYFKDHLQEIVQVKNAILIGYDVNNYEVVIPFIAKHHFPVPLTIESYISDLYINNNLAGYGDLPEVLNVLPFRPAIAGQFMYSLDGWDPFAFSNKEVLRTNMNYLTKGDITLSFLQTKISIPYSLSGTIKAKPDTTIIIPIEKPKPSEKDKVKKI